VIHVMVAGRPCDEFTNSCFTKHTRGAMSLLYKVGRKEGVESGAAPVLDDEANKGHAKSIKHPKVSEWRPWRLDSFLTHEWWAPCLVLIAALFTRFYKLPEPPGVGAFI